MYTGAQFSLLLPDPKKAPKWRPWGSPGASVGSCHQKVVLFVGFGITFDVVTDLDSGLG